MSQHDFEITTADANSGASFRAAVNAAFQALASNNSGVSEPTVMYAYQLWADLTSGYLKLRNAANDAWISLFLLVSGGVDNATQATAGVVELDTNTEALTGADTTRAMTAANVKYVLDNRYATDSTSGLVILLKDSSMATPWSEIRPVSQKSICDYIDTKFMENPMLQAGDMIGGGALGVLSRIAGGASAASLFLRMNSAGTKATWVDISQQLALVTTAGSNIGIASADTARDTSSTSYTKLKDIDVLVTGTVSVYFELKGSYYGNSYGRIYKNGIAVGTERNTSSNEYVSYSEDIAVTSGDNLQLYAKNASGVYVRYFRITCNNSRIATIVTD